MDVQFAPSLFTFYKNHVEPRLSSFEIQVLDLGAGQYSLFENTKLNKNLIEAIDITHKKEISISEITYTKADILQPKIFKNKYYDLIFDSHCLHCLGSTIEQNIAIANIYNSLKPDGLFASEIMVQPNKNNVFFPHRQVSEARELEQELVLNGFKIIYFVIAPQMHFYYHEGNNEITCDMLGVIAKK